MSTHSPIIRRIARPAALSLALLSLGSAGLLITTTPAAHAQRAAYKPSSATDALASLTAYLGPRATNRIISMKAEEGRPEPLYWEIVLLEPSAPRGRRILRAGGGQVFYDRTPIGIPGSAGLTPILNIGKFKLDSGRAFRIAEKEAVKNRIAFNHANYTLQATSPESAPVWTVTLVDDLGDTVGKVDISSQGGRVLNAVWNPAKVRQPVGRGESGPPPGPPAAAPGEEGGNMQRVGRSIDRGFNRLRKVFD